jgi:hypothetical protein
MTPIAKPPATPARMPSNARIRTFSISFDLWCFCIRHLDRVEHIQRVELSSRLLGRVVFRLLVSTSELYDPALVLAFIAGMRAVHTVVTVYSAGRTLDYDPFLVRMLLKL